ncbi:hypothetical protein [Sphingosinicella humi]|nr:hypothetical protein [Sphingosinicella humi]
MAASEDRRDSNCTGHGEPPPDSVAGGAEWRPIKAAALVGGAVAATAGAWLGTRAIAQRNARPDGRRVNSVMANAITACDVAHKQTAPRTPREPSVEAEPPIPMEPRV